MNTAAENADNSLNTSNLFNISEQAKANLWQQSADLLDWVHKNAESDKDRAYNLAQYSIQRNDFLKDLDQAKKDQLEQQMGDFVLQVFLGLTNKLLEEI